MTIAVGDLIRQLSNYGDENELYFGGLDYGAAR